MLDNYLAGVSVALGLFLLVISLLEWGAAYGAKADALHRNAEDLTAYHIKLAHVLARIDLEEKVTNWEVDALRVEYETIKDRCPHNHEPCDDELFRSQQRLATEFRAANGEPAMNKCCSLFVKARWKFSTIWFFLLVWIVVAVAFVYFFYVPKI